MPKTQRIAEIEQRLADFLLDARAAGRAAGTLRFYRQKLDPFLAFLAAQDVTTPEQITPAILRAFLVHLQSNHTSGGVHAYWRAVRAFVRFLVREDAISHNPLLRVRPPELTQPLLDPVDPATVEALLAVCDATQLGRRDAAIFLTLFDTGLRAGELVALLVGDVDQTDGAITVRKGKGGKGRVVFIGPRTRRALRAYLRSRPDHAGMQDNAPLFATRHGVTLTYDGLRGVVTRRAKQAGIAAPTLHSFRRAFALAMLRNGADVVSLSRLMGHGSLPVIQRYLKQLKDDLGAVHRRYGPVDSLLNRPRGPPRARKRAGTCAYSLAATHVPRESYDPTAQITVFGFA